MNPLQNGADVMGIKSHTLSSAVLTSSRVATCGLICFLSISTTELHILQNIFIQGTALSWISSISFISCIFILFN
jgi:hypothetical protein